MSHEIRTPMNGIIGMAHLAERDAVSPTVKTYVEKIEASADALLRIINEILDYSKLEASKISLQYREFDLHELMDRMRGLMEYEIDRKGIAFNIEYGTGLGRYFSGDDFRLFQVVMNLIGNAVKFTHEGHVTLHIAACGEERVCFEVEDTGTGIEEAELEKLFIPFSQLDEGRDRKYGGTGLGLSICKQLVELMGGTIWVKSEPNKGSVFGFEIPLPEANLPASMRSDIAESGKKRTDDRREIQQSMKDPVSEKVGGLEELEHMLDALEDALKSKRPKRYRPIIAALKKHEIPPEVTPLFTKLIMYVDSYDLDGAIRLLQERR
jgi:nitrogen-specific signal transduction histidine kinase